jgi:hypothetical protein
MKKNQHMNNKQNKKATNILNKFYKNNKNSDKFASFLFYVIIIVIIFVFIVNYNRSVELIEAKDGHKYLVRKLPDKQDAANMLADIRSTLSDVVNIIKSKSITKLYEEYNASNDSKTELLSLDDFNLSIKRLINNYNPKSCVFSENVPNSKYTAYSVNKGEELVFCLRLKKEGDTLVPLNTIRFVALHELTHIMTKTIGHEPEFWNNFAFILKIAIDDCLYTSIDYGRFNKSKKYCSIDITSTPYHTAETPDKCKKKP